MLDLTLVRWSRSGSKQRTHWHILTDTLSDTHGRTGCGRRYPRKGADHQPVQDRHAFTTTGHVCANCLRALASEPEAA